MTGSASSLLRALRDPDVEALSQSAATRVGQCAERVGLPAQDVDLHLRLHLPLFPRADLRSRWSEALVDHLLRTLAERLRDVAVSARDHARRAGWPNAFAEQGAVAGREGWISGPASTTPVRYRLGAVGPEAGSRLQARNHYLRSPRPDTSLHFGMTLEGADDPLNYAAVSPVDRPYMWQAIDNSFPSSPACAVCA